jgi:hypothetical protein
MAKLAKGLIALMVLVLAVYLPMTHPSSATSAELAKQCRAMAIKAHPNPIPGSKASGAEKAQREYFQACIAKGGKMENKRWSRLSEQNLRVDKWSVCRG